MIKIMIHLSVFLFCALATALHAAPVAIDTEQIDGIAVGRHLLLLEDKDGTFQADEVAALPETAFFQSPDEVPNLKFTKSVYWGRLELSNTTNQEIPLIMEYGYPIADYIDFYSPAADGTFKKSMAGDWRPLSQRILTHRVPAFPFDLKTGSSTFLIRIQTDGVVQFPLKIWSPLKFHDHRMYETGFLLFLLGILGVMIFYNFFVAIKTQDHTSYAYIGYLIGVVIFYVTGQTGLLSLTSFDTVSVFFMNTGYLLAINFAALFGLILCVRFLDITRSLKFLYYTIHVLMAATVFNAAVALIDYNLGSKLAVATISTSSIVVLSASFTRSFQRYRPAYYFSLAWFCVVTGNLIYTLTIAGVLPSHPISYFAASLGMALEVILISLAIGDKIHWAQVESEQKIRHLNEVLELKVEEKTRDIRSIMTHIPLGVFAITPEQYKIHKDYSEHLHELFEVKDLVDLNAWSLLFDRSHLGSDEKSQVMSVLDACLGEDILMFEMNAQSLPIELRRRRLSGEERFFDLTWNPITNNEGRIEKILVTMRDVTEIQSLKEDAQDKKEELQFIGELINVPNETFRRFIDSCRDFITENRKLINSTNIQHKDIEILKVLFINMHTMKGAARSLYLKKMTRIFHDVEQYYAVLQADPHAKWDIARMNRDINDVESIVTTYMDINKHKLGRKTDDEKDIELSESQVLRLYQDLLTISMRIKHVLDDKTQAILRDLRNWIFPKIFSNVSDIFTDIGLSLGRLAKDLGKITPELRLINPDLYLNRRGEDLIRKIFVHILRNSMDHGIETPSERLAAGKPERGLITITMDNIPGGVKLLFQDDGRGLNLIKIRKMAEHHGFITPEQQCTQEEIAELIFRSGLSTVGQISDISGRGVGMDAVRSFLLNVDGNVRIHLLKPRAGDSLFHPFYFEIYLPDALFAGTGEDLVPSAA